MFDYKYIQKMIFLHNAIENGWTVEKKNELYIFKKKHHQKDEYFKEIYIDHFIKENLQFQKKM